jgi:hypothetical protein
VPSFGRVAIRRGNSSNANGQTPSTANAALQRARTARHLRHESGDPSVDKAPVSDLDQQEMSVQARALSIGRIAIRREPGSARNTGENKLSDLSV